jgi:hypothetical protein
MPAAKSLTPPRSPDALPPDLRALWEKLPPRLRLKRAQEVSQRGRQTLYNKAANGDVIFYKDGRSTTVDTLSLLLDMAALPVAKIKASVRSKATTSAADRSA